MRAAVFAVVCVLLTALGHSLMSAQELPWWSVAGALLAVYGCGWWLAAEERDVPSVTAVAVAVQAVLHGGFTFAEMSMQAPSAHSHTMTLAPMLGMFGVHLILALLSGLWLAYGERAAFQALTTAAHRIRTAFALVDAIPQFLPRLRHPRALQLRTTRRWRLVHAIVSRGPPGTVAV
ncbi:hypothetical protein GCM10009534_46340 [Kribbella sandramycini]